MIDLFTSSSIYLFFKIYFMHSFKIYLFIYLKKFFLLQGTQFPRAEILSYRNFVQNGRGADSEIVNASARQAALKHGMLNRNTIKNFIYSFIDLFTHSLMDSSAGCGGDARSGA